MNKYSFINGSTDVSVAGVKTDPVTALKGDPLTRVFVSGQHTLQMFNRLQRIITESQKRGRFAVISASCPPFNIRNEGENWKEIRCTRFDIPVYGVLIPRAIAAIFREPRLAKELHIVGDTRVDLSYHIDKFVQSKMTKVDVMIERFPDDMKMLKTFVDKFRSCKDEDFKDENDWLTFVKECGIPDGWERRLHVDEVLQLFGIKDAKPILEAQADKFTTFRDFAVTWVSKALAGYKVKGCLTDVVNLIFAVSRAVPAKTEREIVDVLLEFNGLLLRDCTFEFWIPDVMIIDLEKDDLLCAALVRRISKECKVEVQLPTDIPKGVSGLVRELGWTPFTDPDSKNLDAIRSTFDYPEIRRSK